MFKIACKVMSKETGKKWTRIALSIEDKVNIIELGTLYAVLSECCKMRDRHCGTSIRIIMYNNAV